MPVPFDPTQLRFDNRGLLPTIAQDIETGEVLMLAWMNAEAVAKTLKSKQVTYWSRSRESFWVKGATSGNTQELISMAIDCDRDCILIKVRQIGPACHTGQRNCFYTDVTNGHEIETQHL